MIDIAYEPFRKIVVRSYSKMTLDSFLSSIDSINDPGQKGYGGYVNWANGLLYSVILPPATEATLNEYVKGTLYIDSFLFAPMAQYKKTLKVRKDGTLSVTVYNESESSLYGPLTKWIKENLL